jgi:SAM-dependent methyltransferase
MIGNCPWCADDTSSYLTYTNKIVFYRCERCHSLFRDPPGLLIDYTTEYGQNIDLVKSEVLAKDYFEKTVDEDLSGMDILEVGGSHGAFLKEVKERYATTDILNYELNTFNVDYSNKEGIPATNELSTFQDMKFDRIFCFHVVEHIEYDELLPFFKRFFSMLKPNGKFIILTPSGNATLFRVLGRLYPWIAFPEHTVFLTDTAAKIIASKIDCSKYKASTVTPSDIHYPSPSLLTYLRRRLTKFDNLLLESAKDTQSIQPIVASSNQAHEVGLMKKLFRKAVYLESKLYKPFLKAAVSRSPQKEELLICFET